MNKKLKSLLSLLVIFSICIIQLIPIEIHAQNVNLGENEIIGVSYHKSYNNNFVRVKRSNTLPNWLIIDYDATATSIILKFTNVGVDSIDSVIGKVEIGSSIRKFSLSNVKPGMSTHTVYINMTKCHEDIKVYTVAMDGGDSLGTSETPGERNIPNNLLNLWARGSFLTNEACLEYHFMIHSGELGISNIVSYVNSAQSFRSNLRGASSSHVSGKLKNVTRWKKNGKYVDISGSKNTGLLVSYGRS